MGINISIIKQEFLNQFNNGEFLNSSIVPQNVTNYLTGNAGELLKNNITFTISWTAQSSVTDIFNVNGNTLSRSGTGDFETDGFQVGDIIDGWELSPNGAIFQDRTILTITPTQITFDGASVPAYLFVDGKIYGKTPLENIIFNYGLIENSSPVSFVSAIDGTAENEFFASGVGVDTGGGVRDTSFIPMSKATGVNSWKTTNGSAEIQYVSTANQSDDFAQKFIIGHIFRLLPYYLDGWLPNLQTLSPPFPQWQSSNTLKYVSQIEMRSVMNNPNSSRKASFSSVQGNTGWIDENFNGFTNNFSITSIVITSNVSGTTLTALDYQESCHVVINVFSDNNVFTGDGTEALGLISYLPSANDYQQNQNTINENFLLDSVFTTRFEAPKSSSIIKNFDITSTTPAGDIMVVEFDVEYTPSQQSLLQNRDYMILIGTGDPSLFSPLSDRVMLLADLNQYTFNLDVPDLMFMDEFKFVPHNKEETTLSLPNDYKGWIEDGFQIQAPFKLNTDAGATLTSLSMDIVAFNTDTDDEFTLQSTVIDLSGAVVSLGVQQINVNTTNNFIIDTNSDFKKIFCQNTGSGTHAGFNVENYDTKVGVRFNFEEWIALLSANTQYFDATQLNNGLNLLTSNYSTTLIFPSPDNYQIKARLNATVNDSTGVSTNYWFLSNDLKAYYYDLDNQRNPNWVCDIETFDTTGNLINVILNDNFTDIKATFTKNPSALPVPPDLVGAWGWLRLDVQQGTINTPFQISTIYLPTVASSPLIPLPTETKCKLTNLGGTVLLEARINNDFIPSGSVLSITARLGEGFSDDTWEISNCEDGASYYTTTDLTAYIGTIIYIDSLDHCFEVIGLSTNAPTYPSEPITVWGDDYESCESCFQSQKLTEAGNQKYEENGTNKIIE